MLDRRQFIGTGGLALAGLTGGCTRIGRKLGIVAEAPPPVPSLVADVQERAFRFFWDTTDPASGLSPDRWPTPSFSSIASVGFALTAYPIGVLNGWITREEARARTLTTLEFFAAAPQGPDPTGTSGYKGFFYHFLGTTKGNRFEQSELSTIDTTLLLGGVLFAGTWFDGDDADEKRIRMLSEQLYAAVDWTWIIPRAPYVSMGWNPEGGFIASDWNVYNESPLLYILAIGSPSHPLPPETWTEWTRSFEPSWSDKWGPPHIAFPPLFGHQYSQIWLDFRGISDAYIATKGIDYFENSKRATEGQRAYATANPGGWVGYDQDVWGLTACDGPGDFTRTIDGRERQFFSYSARGPENRDDGTLAPTASIGSIAFAPDIVIPAMEAMHARYGLGIYGQYGFYDSFNPTLTDPAAPLKHGRVVPGLGWVDGDYLGIDQGPIVAGIENWKSGMIWATMRKNPHIRRGLERAGFTGGWLAAGAAGAPT